LLDKVAEVLGVSDEDLKWLMEQDRIDLHRRFEEWCSKSESPHLVVRLIPGVYKRIKISGSVPADQLEHYAATTAAEKKMQTCLVLNRRDSVWFDEEGQLKFRQTATA